METDSGWRLLALVILLGASAFFSASETALMSLSKIRVRHMSEEGVKGIDLVHRLITQPGKLLGTILVGNNAVNVAASALATSLAIDHFKGSGIGIATAIMTILILVFSEITPKSLAAQHSEKVSLKVAGPLSILVYVLNPIVILFSYVSNGLIRLLGGSVSHTGSLITVEELRTVVTLSQEQGVLKAEEEKMIHNVFDFTHLQIKDAMLQRTDIVALNANITYEHLVSLTKEEQFSRYPVYRDTVDHIIGILNVKDLVFLEEIRENFKIEDYLREAFFFYEFNNITAVFKEMKRKRAHMAIVIDEYGGTAGIVTLEDLIEKIVGDIDDEYDDYIDDIQSIKENEFLVAGSTRIEVANEMMGLNLESEDFDSVGGFLIGQLGRLPIQGERVLYGHVVFVVEEIDRNRIKKIRVIV